MTQQCILLHSLLTHVGVNADDGSWFIGRSDFLETHESILEFLEAIPGFQGSRKPDPPVNRAVLTPKC